MLDVCVDYVGRDGTLDMDEIAGAVRDPGVAAARVRLDRAAGRGGRSPAPRRQGDPQLRQPRGRRRRGQADGPRVPPRPRVRRGGHLPHDRRRGPGAHRRLEAARRERIYDIAIERYGLEPTDLIFDPLTFPLSTGDDDLRRDAMETIEAIRRIKTELPGASTILGLSNVSFGLKPAARHVLNSVFLHECREAGLDAAIVHAARIVPLNRVDERQREVALDLIYDRRRDDYDPLTEFMALFEGVEAGAIEKEDRSGWPVTERLSHRIIDGDRDGLETDLDEALTSLSALEIVNDVLLDGMKVVGELFATGEMQLPFVLQSAETMKTAVAYLEPHMEKADAAGKGVVVLATVKGDVHDIGKNLVDIILTNNGYMVYNLGIKIAITEMIDKALEVERRRDRHEWPAREVDDHHAREPRGAEHARSRRSRPGAARRRRAHTQLRGARPARGLRGSRVLRQGRVRGPAHHGNAHGRQALRRSGSRIRARGGRPPAAAPQERTRRGRAGGGDTRSLRRRAGRADLHAAVPRLARRQGHLDRRHRRLHQRDRPLPQPVAVPPREGRERERRRLQGAHPADAARAARGREAGRAPPPGRGLGLLRRQCGGQRPRRVEGRHAHTGVAALLVPAPAQGAVLVHRRLLPARRIGRARLRGVPRRDDGHRAHRNASRSCSPPTGTRSTCCSTGCPSR